VTIAKNALQIGKEKGLPSDAVPVSGMTASDITGTTAVAALAPSASTKALYVTDILVHNKTIAEDPVITIQSNASTPVPILQCLPSTAGAGNGHFSAKFDPPVKVATGKSVMGVAASAVGDCRVTVNGYEGTPGV